MALKTQRKINTLSDEVNIKRCNPQDIAIPKDIITKAKGKWKIIEKAYKEYGPGVINNLLSIGKKYTDKALTPDEKFINMIKKPYETLCFYESYFEDTSNFNEIEKIFEKARKSLETAAKRSKTFKDALDHHGFVYKTDEVKELKYKENPDNDSKTKFTMLKDENGNSVPKFACYCTNIINNSYTNYEKAHNMLRDIKKEKTKEITKNYNKTYNMIKNATFETNETFKDLCEIPDKINKLIKNAHTKKHRFQTKLFSSEELDKLIHDKNSLENNLISLTPTIKSLSLLKYGNNANIIFKETSLIDDLYNHASDLHQKLSSRQLDYNRIQKNFDELIRKQKELTENVKKIKLDSKTKYQEKEIKQIYLQIKSTTATNKESIRVFNNYIDKVSKAIEQFQESYTAKSWAKWIGLKTGITFLNFTKALNEVILNLTRYNDALKFVKDIGKYIFDDGDNPLFFVDDSDPDSDYSSDY